MRAAAVTLALVAVLAAGCGSGTGAQEGDGIFVGVVDDVVRSAVPDGTDALLEELTGSGFDSLAITSFWTPGLTGPDATEAGVLRAVGEAAERHGVRLFLKLYHPGSATTPLTPEARAEFAGYAAAAAAAVPGLADVIVGNEPNLNRFWLPQFTEDGGNAAAPAYLALLAETYDALEEVDDGIRVWGGATSPRGADRPGGRRPTHSPTAFIRDLGAAYRASGRDRPVMDGFVHHPYAESSQAPIDRPHPRTTTIGLADYDKLVALLGEAFDGTAQPGSDLPLLYGELGVETVVPAEKASLYSGEEPAKPTTEAAQADAYRRALELAACQPTVAGVLLFHVRDEPLLPGWQSGTRYADGAPKASERPVAEAAEAARSGELGARCEG